MLIYYLISTGIFYIIIYKLSISFAIRIAIKRGYTHIEKGSSLIKEIFIISIIPVFRLIYLLGMIFLGDTVVEEMTRK